MWKWFRRKRWAVAKTACGYVEWFRTEAEAKAEVERYMQDMLIWENMGIPTVRPRIYKI